MNFEDFYDMPAMKYYHADLNKINAIQMIDNVDNKFIASEKRDGNWCKVLIDANYNVIIQGRGISKTTGKYTEYQTKVPHIVEQIKSMYPAKTVIIGELCFEDRKTDTNNVGSILRCLPEKAIKRQEQTPLCLYQFDCVCRAGEDITDMPYENRIKLLSNNNKEVKIVDFYYNDFMNAAGDIWNNGGEGLVIARKDMKYSYGCRPAWQTLKLKKELDEIELPVVDTLEPTRYYDGKCLDGWKYYEKGIAVTKPYAMKWKNGIVVLNGKTKVSITSGLTDDDREWLASEEAATAIKNGELFAAVGGMEITEDGSIRHPVLIRLRLQEGV